MAIRLRTNNPREVRKTISRVINMVVNKQLDSKEANAIILGCNAILSAIRVDEQQRKIEELEQILKDIDKNE